MTGPHTIRKLRAPGLASWVIDRPRIDHLLGQHFENVDVIEIAAAPGSGKTVAAQLFSLRFAWPTAWLNLDTADRSGSRVVDYLARGLEPFLLERQPDVRESLRSGMSPTEAAAELGDRIRADDLLLVFDNCEEIVGQPEAEAVLRTLIGCLPGMARVLLLSREPLDAIASGLEGRIVRLGAHDLALDIDETELLLRTAGQEPDRAEELVSLTRGWAAGIIFDAGVPPTRVGSDLVGYLNHEILDRLEPEEQDLLLRTALLDKVTPAAMSSIGVSDGTARLERLGRHRLPATVEADGGIVYHPFFRQFLQSQLEERLPAVARSLRQARAGALVLEGRYAEAMQLLFDNDDLTEATSLAASALPALVAAGDWGSLLEWLDRLGPARVEAHPVLVAARIRCLTRSRQFFAAQSAIRDLDRRGLLPAAVGADPDLVAELGWAFLSHPGDGLAIMAEHPQNERAESIRYTLQVIGSDQPVAPPPVETDSGVGLILSWGLLLQGRFDLLTEIQSRTSALAARRSVPTLLTMVWTGRLDQVREVLDQIPHDDQGLLDYVEALVLLADDDAFGALRAAQEAVARSQRARFGWDPFLQLAVGLALVRTGRLPEARSLLADAQDRARSAGEVAYVDWADVYHGLCHLVSGANGAAVQVLQSCVDRLELAGRRLVLPAALVYLAEAEARSGALGRAERLAQRAARTADEMGSPALFTQSLPDAPWVAARVIDASKATAPRPQDFGAVTTVPAPPPAAEVRRVEVQPFGDRPDVWIDGSPCGVRRLKVIELAAYLAVHDGVVSRQQIQLDLFPEHDQRTGSNYFRQITHQFRRSTGITLSRWEGDLVGLPPGSTLSSADVVLERAMSAWSERSEAIGTIIDVIDGIHGEYLRSSVLPWAQRRRFELGVLEQHAVQAAGSIALEQGRQELAERLAERALAADPDLDEPLAVLLAVAEASTDPDHRDLLVKRVRTSLAERYDDQAEVERRFAALRTPPAGC